MRYSLNADLMNASPEMWEDLFASMLPGVGFVIEFDSIMLIYLLLHSDFRMSRLIMVGCRPDHRIRMMSQIAFAKRGILLDLGTWQDQRSGTVGLKDTIIIVALLANFFVFYYIIFYY